MASSFSNGAKGVTSQAPDAPDTTLVRAPEAEPTDPERKVGHDCEFVERPPKQFQSECSICLLILRDPHLISCCGHSFCEACIGRIREDGKPCPLCNKPGYMTLPNQGLQRALNEFDVSCSHRELGSEWVGTLGSLDGHLNAEPQPDCQLVGCHFVMVKCIHCKTYMRRLAIAVHQNEHCPKRSGIERQDLEHHVQEDCPLEIVDCSLHYAGCEVRLPRKDLAGHMREDSSSHVALLAAENQRMAKQLLEKDKQIQDNVQQLTKENADLRSYIDELKGELVRQQRTTQEVAGRVEELCDQHQQSEDKLRQELMFLMKKVDATGTLKQELAVLVMKVEALQHDLSTQCQQSKVKLIEQQHIIQTQEGEVVTLRKQSDQHQQALCELEETIAALKLELPTKTSAMHGGLQVSREAESCLARTQYMHCCSPYYSSIPPSLQLLLHEWLQLG